jgi:hypothetical protein
LTYPENGRKSGKNNRNEPFTALEKEILDCFPSTLATQQRLKLFLQENQKTVINNAKLTCIPCGMMAELLYLDFSNVANVQLTGIDLDPQALMGTGELSTIKGMTNVTLLEMDA